MGAAVPSSDKSFIPEDGGCDGDGGCAMVGEQSEMPGIKGGERNKAMKPRFDLAGRVVGIGDDFRNRGSYSSGAT
jgi:hypothetical protein